jgi:uncharacterized coiled-coil protein SlyX
VSTIEQRMAMAEFRITVLEKDAKTQANAFSQWREIIGRSHNRLATVVRALLEHTGLTRQEAPAEPPPLVEQNSATEASQ